MSARLNFLFRAAASSATNPSAPGVCVLGAVASSPFGAQPFRHQQTDAASSPSAKKPDRADKSPKQSASFAFNLFKGEFKSDQVFPYPARLTSDQKAELAALTDPLHKWVAEVNDPLLNDRLETVPPEVMEDLAKQGAFGLQVPPEYEGLGLGTLVTARLGEIVGGNDLGLSIVIGAHQSIGYKGILLFGTEDQKKKYLPDLAAGRKIAAFALTEPTSGSDAASIRSRAEINEAGTHYILNGSKIWISNAGIADVFTVFCKTPVKDEKTGTTEDKVTALVVERAFGGVTTGSPNKKMGIKCSNTSEIYFDNVPIPVENVLDAPGKGFKVAMHILNNGRFGMGAALSGTMRNVIAQAADFASQRTQFGKHIHHFGTIQEKLAHMSILHFATESVAYTVAGNMDAGAEDYQIEAAISKIFSSENAWKVTDEAIQVMGGMGFMQEAGLEKRLRDLRIFRIFEGTNDILRLFVALTGLQFAGPHLKALLKKIQNPLANPGVVAEESTKRALRLFGVSQGPPVQDYAHPSLAAAAKKTSKAIENFGVGCEFLLRKYGMKVIDHQMPLNRLADAAIDVYVSVCVLSRTTYSLEQGLDSAKHELLMANLWCDLAYERILNNLSKLDSANNRANNQALSEIANNLVQAQGVVQGHPLGV